MINCEEIVLPFLWRINKWLEILVFSDKDKKP